MSPRPQEAVNRRAPHAGAAQGRLVPPVVLRPVTRGPVVLRPVTRGPVVLRPVTRGPVVLRSVVLRSVVLGSVMLAACRVGADRRSCDVDVDCADGDLCYEDGRCLPPDVARQLGAMVGEECRVVAGRSPGCEDVCVMGYCDGAPRFAGATVAVSDGPDAVSVRWSPPEDRTPAARMRYHVYTAAVPGAEDFGAPALTVQGATSAHIDGLAVDVPFYAVVRAEDEYGQVDGNTREVRAVPGCVAYDVQVQPLLDARCVRCHGPERAARGLRFDSRESLSAGLPTRPQVIPCRPDLSRLLRKLGTPPALDDRGPHGGIEPAEVELLRRWVEDGASAVCPVDHGLCANASPPTFGGLESVTPVSTAAISLCWSPAEDDATDASRIVYDVYRASAPGAQAFDALPEASSDPGQRCVTLAARVPGERECWVVRARDGAGHTDANTVERCIINADVACVDYGEVIQPLFDRRCIHCHGGEEPLRMLSLEGFGGVLAGGRSGELFSACAPEVSLLAQKLQADPPVGVRMPGDGPPYLSDAEITAVRRWIREGARLSCMEPDPC